MAGYFITGTDTEIGKTHSSVKLIKLWQSQGKKVLAMKPVASGCEVLDDGRWVNDDVQRLIAATGQDDNDTMNPYRFLPPISPHIAARQADVEISLSRIGKSFHQLEAVADCVIVEAAGGWFAPLSDELFMEDMARYLDLPVILVVGMRLGCINHAVLTAKAIEASGLTLAGWVANQIVPAQLAYQENLQTLRRHIRAPLLMEIPYQP